MTVFSLQTVGYLATGLTAGIIAGMFGIGGGILIVPALLFLFYLDGINPVIAMQLAVSTSLATIIFTNLSATWSHHQRHSVHWPLVRQYMPGVFLGAWLGAQIAAHLQGELLRSLFGLFEIAVGLLMILGASPTDEESSAITASAGEGAIAGTPTLHGFLAIAIGLLSTLFGIGGGTMLVPAITLIAKLPIRHAIGSASAIGAFLAAMGTTGLIHAGWENSALPDNTVGFVVPLAAISIVAGTLTTTPIGVKLAHTIAPRLLKKGFGCLLLLVGVKLLCR